MEENERDERLDSCSVVCPITGRRLASGEHWLRFLDPAAGEYYSVAPQGADGAGERGWRRVISESDPEYVKRHVREMGEQLQDAGALIDSLEEEVAALRLDLQQAWVAVHAAQEEIQAREEALQSRDGSLEQANEAWRAEVAELEERHRREVGELRAELEQLKAGLDTGTEDSQHRSTGPSDFGQEPGTENEAPESSLLIELQELREQLEEREAEREDLRQQLQDERQWSEDTRQQLQSELLEQHEEQLDRLERRLREMGEARDLAAGQTEALELEVAETERENRYLFGELAEARRRLEEFADPERRLRAGIALFNQSSHSRIVASTSNSFGLPRVHVRLDGSTPGKARLTFVWGILGWRRYLADPTEEVEEPRVYLEGSGDEPGELPAEEARPNARIDDRGRVSLGVQAL